MKKKTLVNAETENSVIEYLNKVKNKTRQADGFQLLSLFEEVTKKQPKMWGKSIVGYGKYTYQRKNGDEFEWFNTGFSSGSAHLSIYVMYDINTEVELLNQLGPHKTGKGCLYIKKLSDINIETLKLIIAKSDRWSSH